MAAICNQIRETPAFINYQNQFPKQVWQKAAQGFALTAALSLIVCSSTVTAALIGGALAASATLIEAIARPLIKMTFPEHPVIGYAISIFTPTILTMAAFKSVPFLTNSGFNPGFGFWKGLSWFCLNPDYYDRNVGLVEVL